MTAYEVEVHGISGGSVTLHFIRFPNKEQIINRVKTNWKGEAAKRIREEITNRIKEGKFYVDELEIYEP